MAKGRIFLIFHGRFPGEKAASVFTAKSAEAFADAGLEVTVLAPRRIGRAKETPEEYFGVKGTFRVVYISVLDLFPIRFFKNIAFTVSYLLFSAGVWVYLISRASRDANIYSNEALPLLFASLFFKQTFYEVHDFPRSSVMHRMLVSRVRGIIATNRWKRDELVRRFRVAREKILYEPNAVDAFRFGSAVGNAVRQKLPLPTGTVVVGYAGTLKTMDMEKGIQTLLEAMAALPPRFRCLIIGGLRQDIESYREESKKLGISDRVVFAGWMHYDSVPEHLAACDVLVAPFPKTPHYDLYMSPMKLFEYMAVGKPIVASRLHSIEEILDDSNAFLVSPDDSKALAEGIMAAVSDSSAQARAQRAREAVQSHSWHKRAERILGFLGTY